MRVHFALILILALVGVAAAQPDTLWTRTFGGAIGEECRSVKQTTDGGYILAGVTQPPFGIINNVWLIKTNANGDSLWSRTFGGGVWADGNSVLQTADGGYLLAGNLESSAWVLKTDANGDSLWSRSFSPLSGDASFASALQTPDGSFILAGDYLNACLLVKIDSAGNTLWTRTYGQLNCFQKCSEVQQTSDGGYVLAGSSDRGQDFYSCYLLIKTNSEGDSLWSQFYHIGMTDYCASVRLTTDGGFLLAGRADTPPIGSRDSYWIVRTDSNGDSLWSRSFGCLVGESSCYATVLTADGGLVMAGATSCGCSHCDTGFGLFRINANGDSVWGTIYENPLAYDAWCRSVQPTVDGGYILAGGTLISGSYIDFWLVKTGPDPVAVDPTAKPSPIRFSLLPVYPNPFNASTRIAFAVPRTGAVSLKVYDVQGRQVETLIDRTLEAGEHDVRFDGGNLASGIYFARLQAGNSTQTQKMVLLK